MPMSAPTPSWRPGSAPITLRWPAIWTTSGLCFGVVASYPPPAGGPGGRRITGHDDATQLGPDHPDVARSLDNLGIVHRRLGDLDTADTIHQRALALRE